MKNILFISWDGPQTSYMEGLFFPIFQEIQNQSNYKIHVLQFTWASNDKLKIVNKAALKHNIVYSSRPIHRKPIASIGSFYTLLLGLGSIKKYIKKNHIDIIMPRSNFPAMMVNWARFKDVKIVFDADGLALEERVDFSGLRKKSLVYKLLSSQERKMLLASDAVLVRSNKSTQIHLSKIGEEFQSKFFKVLNGRDISFFRYSETSRNKIRSQLQVKDTDTVFVSCGSLGPQYGWSLMIDIFKKFKQQNSTSKFLVLTGNTEFAIKYAPETLKKDIIIKSVSFSEVPSYLSAADVAFALRQPTYSMQGVSPIKLGEYLLMQIPTIASKGIGDTEELLNGLGGTYIFDHNDSDNIKNAVTFANNIKRDQTKELRIAGESNFSLSQSAKSYIAALHTLH